MQALADPPILTTRLVRRALHAADADRRNLRSMRLFETLNFLQERRFRARHIVDGEVSDSAMFGLLRPDGLQRGRSPA